MCAQVALLLTTCGGVSAGELAAIQLPPGFSISIYAEVPGARSMVLGPAGTVFVGSRSKGKVYAVRDTNGDARGDEVHVLARELNSPNGVAVREGALYVAEISRILRFDAVEDAVGAESEPEPVVVRDDLPMDEHHGWKFMAFDPAGEWLYVPVGAPCNVCQRDDDERYASILRMRPDGSELELFARGVRNTVGFAWHPETGELWFTDNGRDRLGDDLPPDELNHAPTAGLHFGFPHCHGRDVLDPDFGYEAACDELTPPARELGPHVAALGMRFYTGEMFPEEYRGDIFIAEHGSWDRTVPIGYRVTRVKLDPEGGAPSYEVFASGWLDEDSGEDWGRPVDVLVMPDGALLVSDDAAGVIYRIHYTG